MHVAKDDIAKYSACYKLALFMTLFTTAFRLGIEPFSLAMPVRITPGKSHATITKYL
jgi:hypothetical protein